MKKSRFYFAITSYIIIILSISLSLYYPGKLITLSYFVTIFLLLSSFIKKRNEVNEIRSYLLKYVTDYEVNEFVENINNFEKKCIFFNKKQRRSFNLYHVQAYIDQGDFNKAEELLLDIDLSVNSFNKTTKFIYLISWCDLFFYQKKPDKMLYTIEKLTTMIDNERNANLKFNFIKNVQSSYWKYQILTNRNLDKIKPEIDRINLYLKNQPVLMKKVEFLYMSGLIHLKEKNYSEGIKKFEELKNIYKNENAYIVKETNKILDNYYKIKNISPIGEEYLSNA